LENSYSALHKNPLDAIKKRKHQAFFGEKAQFLSRQVLKGPKSGKSFDCFNLI